MYRFMRAGFIAAYLQTVLAMIVVFLALAQGGTQQSVPTSEFLSTTPLDADRRAVLALVDVHMAVGVSLLRTRAVTWSARQLSAGFRRLNPRNPDRAAVALISQLLLASLGFVAVSIPRQSRGVSR